MIASLRPLRTLAAFVLAALGAFAGVPDAADAAELVVFGSAHCPYCLAWEQEIGRGYGRTREGQEAPLRRVDVNARRSGEARMREVDTTPTFILVDGEGREAGRIVGYSGPQQFWPQLHRLLERLHPLRF